MKGSRIQAIVARLPVANLSISVDFYRRVLGFSEIDLWPDCSRPTFAILRSGTLELQLSQREGPTSVDSKRAEPASLWCDVEGIEALHRAVVRTVAVEWGPEVYSYGRQEFAIRDPDGHLIVLSESAPPT